MKKVCLFNFPPIENFHGYHIDSLNPAPYFRNSDGWNMSNLEQRLFLQGARPAAEDGQIITRPNPPLPVTELYKAADVDKLYRQRDPAYMHFVSDFVGRFRTFDLLILTWNPIHPEILFHELKHPIKILGFVDDPMATYVRQLPYFWAFDGAFYVSPSYDDRTYFKEALERWGCTQSYWWPWVPCKMEYHEPSERFFQERDIDLVYVGNQYGPKVDRLVKLKKHFGSRFHLHGRWPLSGYGGMARGLRGKPVLWSRVRSITDEERKCLYHRAKIGINMHLSERMETGNMRMYEVPSHGIMMVCDKAGLDAHEQIFEPGREAVFYDSVEDAIERIEYYLNHEEERIQIARAGYSRVRRDYDWEQNLKRFLDWASRVTKRNS